MRSIFFNGRHDHISLICAAQYMMDVDVSLRTNIDYIFAMRENIISNRQKLHKYYFGQYAKFDDFDKVMTACTQDYRAIVLDGTVASTEATDSVKWYKVSLDLPTFQLCLPIYWRFSRRYAFTVAHVLRTQGKQFAIDNATAASKKQGVVLVQTEDEHGNVVD